MYTLIGDKRSRAMRVLWLLHELDVDFEVHAEPPHSEKVLAQSPSGKIPVLLVDDVVLTDSVAIMTFLADKHSQFTYPAGSIKRAVQDGFTQTILDELDAILWTASRHKFVLPKEHRVPKVRESLVWEFTRNTNRLGVRLGDGPYLMGDKMTVPDILLSHCIGWAKGNDFVIESPEVLAHHTMMKERPAFRAALAG